MLAHVQKLSITVSDGAGSSSLSEAQFEVHVENLRAVMLIQTFKRFEAIHDSTLSNNFP